MEEPCIRVEKLTKSFAGRTVVSESYETVLKFIEENGYEIAGAIRESYIDGIWNKDDESQWLSEIQVPIKKRQNPAD